jgi:hypothetical protein
VREEKAREVEELVKLELMMIHKQASSKMTSEQSELRLKQLLNGSKTSTNSSVKLPSISPPKKRNSERDLHVI